MDVIHLARMRGYHREWCNAPRVEDDVLVLNPFTAIPFRDQFFLNRQWVANASYRWCMPSIGRQLSRAGRENPEIIWSARPGSGVLKKMFPGAFMAVQVVDYYPAFRGDYIKSIEKHDYEQKVNQKGGTQRHHRARQFETKYLTRVQRHQLD